MNNTANKKDIFYIVVLILTFITVIIGATFAIFTAVYEEPDKIKPVYTGSLSIEYLSGEIIKFNMLYPTEKPTLDTEDNVYKNNFKVTNTGSLDSKIEISIEINKNNFENTMCLPDKIKIDARPQDSEIDGLIEINENDSNCQQSEREVDARPQYLLYSKEGEIVQEGQINKEDKLIKISPKMELEKNQIAEYTLFIWIAEIGENQPGQMNKSLTGQIRVDAAQKIN